MIRDILHRAAALIIILSLSAVLACCANPPGTTTPSTEPAVTFTPTEPAVILAAGEYTVNEVAADEAGVTNEECGVTLLEDGTFRIYMGWGAWHEGTYEIRVNTLICTSNTLAWDGGAGPGSRETDVVFTFAIRSENLLELTDITIHDENSDNLVYADGLRPGMTYSIHGNS
ncbi:MAG: hypothetical protein IJ960_04050 [Oscillospiraceae bacterium]|nr:hypothetical protein [Oscillospiraceae bacterium]